MYRNPVAMAGDAAGFITGMEPMFPSCNTQIGDPVLQRLARKMNGQVVNRSPLKDDSALTVNYDAIECHLPRKRPRVATAVTNSSNGVITGKVDGLCRSVAGATEPVSFLGEDLSVQMMQHQYEIDRLIFLQMEKIKIEIEEQRRKQSTRTIEAIEKAASIKLRDKEDQLQKMSKLNAALQERLKSLYLETQLWRDVAQSNEATANALRSNLEHVLAQQFNSKGDGDFNHSGEGADAESCCGSSGRAEEDEWDEIEGGEILRWRKVARTGGGTAAEERRKRLCRRCGGMESSVLVLPCRHLCLCTACGPTVDTCPICSSTKNASVHVNFL